jgi:ketol-acid reductoisomerase
LLREKGVSEALIVQECIQELSYILDVIKKQGLYGMYKAISPIAFSGGIKVWKDIDKGFSVDQLLKKTIDEISSKQFIKQHSNFERDEELEDIRKRSEKFDQAINSLKGGPINVSD